jgi:pimeloyl-ACP methyl ester carboxylesterase
MGSLGARDCALLETGLPVLRSCRLADGATIDYRESGPRDGAPLILLHGLGSHSAGWRGVTAALSDRFRIVAWDAPGFAGSTPLAEQRPGVSNYARRVPALAGGLGIGRFHLAGSSWGAVIAAATAVAAPDRIAGLILLVPNLCLGGLPSDDRQAALDMLSAPGLVLDAAPRDFAAMLTAPDTEEPALGLARTLKDQTRAGGYAQAVRMMGATDTLAFAPSITQETLVLAGGLDQLAPAAQHAGPIAKAIPSARLEILEGFGHLLKLEAPARVADAIRGHLDRP